VSTIRIGSGAGAARLYRFADSASARCTISPHALHRYVMPVPTPFASLAFHPLDGYSQSVPYHLVVFILPIHKWVYLGLFVIINLWTIVVSTPLFPSKGERVG